MESKKNYENICNTYTSIPIFSQSWWMNAICKNNWDVYIVEKGGAVIATFPYYIEEKNNYRKITKPILTQNNGIWFNYPNGIKYNSKLDFEEKVIKEIIDYLESLKLNRYEQQYHYSFTNWLPFYWADFSELIRYTYVIEDTSDIDVVFNNFDSKLKNQIRKAQKIVEVYDDMEIDMFYQINKLTFDRQNLSMPYTYEDVLRLDNACVDRDSRKILYSKDMHGNIHSAIYLVWDNESVYYIMSGSDNEYRDSQSNNLLIYEGIKLASMLGKKFDFEGSVKQNIEKNFRKFGGIQKPYFRIIKEY